MSDSILELPDHATELIDEPEADTSLYLVTANGENGLQVEVVDIRGKVPAAFPPRAPERRTVTDTASFLAEVARRSLLQGLSTVWGNRDKGQVNVIYNELGVDATAAYTRRNDVLTLQFVRDPDWNTLFRAADGDFHRQEEFGDLIEQAGHLITSHPAAELMEIVDSIRTSSSGSFKSQIKRDTGSQHLSYETHGNKITSPMGGDVRATVTASQIRAFRKTIPAELLSELAAIDKAELDEHWRTAMWCRCHWTYEGEARAHTDFMGREHYHPTEDEDEAHMDIVFSLRDREWDCLAAILGVGVEPVGQLVLFGVGS
ncbi:YfdQ family protein [Mycobacteroides abscessus]|uniref:YfdQ family protein n=1 Tax=Mycobacteroides abscessus TaxID=36809 RepID=UPI001F4007E1